MKTVYIERNKLFKDIPMVLCNNITNVDESFMEDNPELFSIDCEHCLGSGKESEDKDCSECWGSGQHDLEMYQSFIVAVNEYEIERLKSFGVRIGYSELLDVHVLGIYDYGTSWSAFSYEKEVADDYELGRDETLDRTTSY